MVRYIADDEEELRTLQEPQPSAYLVLLVKGKVSQSFPLRDEVELGRERGNAVVVADRKVSRRHARLTPIDNTFILTDLGSANGTYVNGLLIGQPTRLKHNDRITLGDTTFLFAGTRPDPEAVYPSAPPVPGPVRRSWPFDSGQTPLWLILGCLVLLILVLLLVLAALFGLLIGRSELLGLAWLAASCAIPAGP